MKKLVNGMHFKMFQKCVSSLEEVVREISLIESKAGWVTFVQVQKFQSASGNKDFVHDGCE